MSKYVSQWQHELPFLFVVDGKYLRIDFSNTVSPQTFVSWVTVQEGHKISAHFGGKQSFYNHKVSSKNIMI